MLELLSGPNAIYRGLAPGSPVAALTDVAETQRAFYDDGLGLCSYSATLAGYCIVQLDGAAFLRSAKARANVFALDLQRPGEWLIHASLFEDALYEFDKRAGTFGALVLSGGTGDMSNIHVRAADRYLSAIGAGVQFRPLDLSAAFVTEAVLSGAGDGRPTWSRTRNGNVLALVYQTGELVYYDVDAGAQVAGGGNLGANAGAWYSVKHDVFVALASDAVKVFANAVRPASLSNPAAIDAIVQGRVSQVRVRLLGSSSDACEGELVNWSITAGSGALKYAQSETDADGYAVNEYIAPVSGGAGSPFGSVTIQAQVAF